VSQTKSVCDASQERDGHRIAFNMAFKENGLKNGDKDMEWDGGAAPYHSSRHSCSWIASSMRAPCARKGVEKRPSLAWEEKTLGCSPLLAFPDWRSPRAQRWSMVSSARLVEARKG
jgi:hypothetical protein